MQEKLSTPEGIHCASYLVVKGKEFIAHSYFSVLPSIRACIRDQVLAAHSVIAHSVSRPHEKVLSSCNTSKITWANTQEASNF